MTVSLGECRDMGRYVSTELSNLVLRGTVSDCSGGIPLFWLPEAYEMLCKTCNWLLHRKWFPYTSVNSLPPDKFSYTKLWTHTSSRGPKWMYSTCSVWTSRIQQTNFKVSERFVSWSYFPLINMEDYILTGWIMQWLGLLPARTVIFHNLYTLLGAEWQHQMYNIDESDLRKVINNVSWTI